MNQIQHSPTTTYAKDTVTLNLYDSGPYMAVIKYRYPGLVFTITIHPKDSDGQHFVSHMDCTDVGEFISGSGWPHSPGDVDELLTGLKKELIKL